MDAPAAANLSISTKTNRENDSGNEIVSSSSLTSSPTTITTTMHTPNNDGSLINNITTTLNTPIINAPSINNISTTTANQPENNFTKILDGLYLTSAKYMTDEYLINHQITHIVNATRTVPLKRNYRTCRVNIIDSVFENIGTHFDSVGEFIQKALDNDGSVVVHCISGISRSSTLVIAYLMKYKNMSLKEAFDFVRSKRWFIRPNTGFFQQLIDYELRLFETNSVKMIYHEMSGGYIPDFILEDKSNYKYFYLCIKK